MTFVSANNSKQNTKVPAFVFPSNKARKGPVFELLLQCKHGTTLSYRRADTGQYEPVMKQSSDHLSERGMDDYDQSIRASKLPRPGLLRYLQHCLSQRPKSWRPFGSTPACSLRIW